MSAKRKKKKAVLPCIITTELPRRSAYHSFLLPRGFKAHFHPSVTKNRYLSHRFQYICLKAARQGSAPAARTISAKCLISCATAGCSMVDLWGMRRGAGKRGGRARSFSQKSGRAPQCGGCRFSQRKGQGPVGRENAVGQPCCTPQKRMSMAENSLRRALSCGERVPSSRPVTMPSPQAHWRAETAYSETEKASA